MDTIEAMINSNTEEAAKIIGALDELVDALLLSESSVESAKLYSAVVVLVDDLKPIIPEDKIGTISGYIVELKDGCKEIVTSGTTNNLHQFAKQAIHKLRSIHGFNIAR